MNRQISLFVAALLLGAVVRIAALPLPGTGDVGVWKLWTYNAAVENPARLYGAGGSPTEWRILTFDGGEGAFTYPPLVAYELSVVGRVYRRLHHGAFPNSTALTVAIKALVVSSEICLAVLIYLAVRATADPFTARWATLAYWLNPALILASSMLGYLDSLAMLPALAALLAAGCGWPLLGGALITAAALTKPQSLLLIPAVVLAFVGPGKWRGAARASGRGVIGALFVAAVIVGPVARVGGWPNFLLAMSSFTHHDMLSGNATNLWWIVGYVLRVIYSLDMGTWNAITMQTKILAVSRVIEIGYPNPRVIGTALVAVAILWALWTARRVRDSYMLTAVGAFLMHAYAVLAAQVHENHLYSAVPLLAVAAARRNRYRRLLWVVTGIFALNLNVFYGISEFAYRGSYMVPRMMTVLDFTVWLSIANCAALVWHATILKREASEFDEDCRGEDDDVVLEGNGRRFSDPRAYARDPRVLKAMKEYGEEANRSRRPRHV